MDDFQDARTADEIESGFRIKSADGFKRWQAEDKIANSTLVDNKNIFHNFQAISIWFLWLEVTGFTKKAFPGELEYWSAGVLV